MAMAGVVSQSEAQQKALDFMARRNAAAAQKGMRLAAKGSQLTPAASEALYYVFNAGQADGFVVVSGDDRTPAILGYATNGTFSEADMPDNMRAWMAEYDRQLRFLANHPNAGIAKVQLDEHAAIAPLLKTTWNQGAPYNDKCPIDPSTSTRCVTGCVATAMAQVINYHKYPASTTATIPAYTSNASISLDAIAPTTIDWVNMLDNYTGSETTEQKNAVATLMQLCGASVKMDYTAHSSGAQSQMVASALKTYFDFDATVYCASRDLYRANAWNNLIYNEIANNRPVCYGGQSMGGGHEFVIDGYDREGLFHVNWGWGGSSDNYFLLSILDPNNNSGTGASTSTDGYSFGQDAIINAMPNKGNVVEDPVRLSISSISTTTTSFDYDSNNEGYVVQFNAAVWNQSGDTGTFDLAMAAYDAQGNMQSGSYIVEEVELGNGWGWKNMNCVGLLDLPDGEYTIFLISKLHSDNYWRPNLGSEKYHLKATVNNNVLTLSGGTVNLSASSITATGSLEIGGMVNVSATITNNSDALFNDVLYLQVDGEDISAKYFEAEAGGSDQFEIVYKPTTTGTKTLSIGYKMGDNFVSIGSKDITISAAHSYSLTFSNGTITNAISSIINADKAQIQVSVKNTGSYAYNDCIKTYAFKNTSGGSSWSYFGAIETPVSIGVGATKTVDIEYNHLTDGRYWFIMVYKTNGEYISHNDTGARYSALYDYTVIVPAPVQPSLEGTYYLQHVESGKFMSAGHNWSTRGIVDEVGLDFTLQTVGENTYTIDSRVSNGGTSNYLGTNLYVDAPAANWVITALSADTYSIGNGTEYLDVDADNELVLTSEPVAWRFMTRSDRLAALEAATVSQGMDATFLLPGANFSRNDSRVGESWVVSGDCTNSDLQNGTNENYCAESYHSTFTISQTIADAPAGRYLLSAQGFYRQDGPTADAPYFFINNEKANVPVKTGSENNMTDAANSFTEGLYTVSGIECELGNDEALTVGVRGTSTTQWVIFDNFRLTYLGPTSQLLNHLTVSASKTSLREGDTFQLTITSEEARGEDWNIQLTCNTPGQFSFNNVVVMPAGQTSVTVDVTAVDDNVAEAALQAEFRVTADGCTHGTTSVWLYDWYDHCAGQIAIIEAIKNQTDVYTGTEAAAALEQTISQVTALANNANSQQDVDACKTQLMQALKQFLSQVTIHRGKAFDLTGLIKNPMMTALDGWEGSQPTIVWYGVSFQNAEFFNVNFDIFQTLSDMPAGNYRLKVQAFQRPGSNDVAYYDYQNGTDNINSYIYINDGQTKIKNVMSEHSPTCLLPESTAGGNSWPDYEWPNGEGFTPNGMEGAKEYFDRGYYENEVLVAIDEGNLRFGFRCTDHAESAWTLFSNFRLYYSGTAIDLTLDENNDLQLITDIDNANVTLQLATAAQQWQALVLPFSLTAEQIADAFGSQATVATLNESFADESLIIFAPTDHIDANVPFLMKLPVAGTTYLLDGCHIVKAAEAVLEGDEFRMVGNYTAGVNVAEGNYVLKNGAITRSTGSDALKSYHAYIAPKQQAGSNELTYTTDGQDPKRIDDDEWSVLKSVYESLGGSSWYRNWPVDHASVTTRQFTNSVSATDGHITHIQLPYNNITGTFPSELLALPHLQVLDLSGNQVEGDIGAVMLSFRQLHPDQDIALHQLNLSGNHISGNIGAFAHECPHLTELNVSGNRITQVIPMISPSVTSLNLDRQETGATVDLHLGEGELPTLPTVLCYNHAMQTYDTSFVLTGCTKSIDDYTDNDWRVTLDVVDADQVNIISTSVQNVYAGANGSTIHAWTTSGSTFQIRLYFNEGDANFNGQVDVTDLQSDVNYIFNEYNDKPFNFTAANLWTDEVINVQDIVKMVDLLLGTAPSRRKVHHAVAESNLLAENASAVVTCQDGILTLNTTVPIASFDLFVENCSSLELSEALKALGFICTLRRQENGMRLIGYSLSGATLPVGETVMAASTPGATVTHVVLSDREASAVSVAIGECKTTDMATPAARHNHPNQFYRLPIGARRAVVIDTEGRKHLLKESK